MKLIMGSHSDRLLKAPLPDIAPRTYRIRNDVYMYHSLMIRIRGVKVKPFPDRFEHFPVRSPVSSSLQKMRTYEFEYIGNVYLIGTG